MSEQKSARYFFALWPDDKTAGRLYKAAVNAIKIADCKFIQASKLHITLIYLGAVDAKYLEQAQKIADQLHIKPFKLQISRLNQWRHAHLLWLGTENAPKELIQLVNHLKLKLKEIGYTPEKRIFIPHITVARRCHYDHTSTEIEPVEWQIKDFHLVKSTNTGQESVYESVASWPLLSR
ncbi:RNA 2',3'-cyclic phosphodiesterase [Legionella israelensis]|uniref:RNA 2',3'-cyclic phosphodiesterase n=1 Tax=Legionella israelensis TaxID=454 RepID=UPI0011812E25|nr:RNA 2',3'-cyclic phosphodiesterase [Legionella israelensis]QDP72927.1 RNA 2',3'-cyclic phosphodiesterase [Legionella israelensis]